MFDFNANYRIIIINYH